MCKVAVQLRLCRCFTLGYGVFRWDKAKVIAQAYLEGREVTEEELLEATYKNGKPKPKKGDWGYVYKGEDGKYYIFIR